MEKHKKVESPITKSIDFKGISTSAVGKNGYSKQVAIHITSLSDRVLFTPENTKGMTTGCELSIPYNVLEEVIEALQDIAKK